MKKTLEDDIRQFDYIFVDTMNMASIAYFSKRNLSFNGIPTGMLYGVLQQINILKKRYAGAKIIFLWEGFNSVRKTLHPIYKSKRKTKLDDFTQSVDDLKRCLAYLGVWQAQHRGLEADDLAGYFTQKHMDKAILLVSNDRDWWGFVRPGSNVTLLIKGVEYTMEELRRETGSYIRREFGDKSLESLDDRDLRIDPWKVPLLKIIKGDSSDGVPGIPRFATAAALEVVRKATCFADLAPPADPKLAGVFKMHVDILKRNHDLIAYHPEWFREDDLVVTRPVRANAQLKAFLQERGLNSALTWFGLVDHAESLYS